MIVCNVHVSMSVGTGQSHLKTCYLGDGMGSHHLFTLFLIAGHVGFQPVYKKVDILELICFIL